MRGQKDLLTDYDLEMESLHGNSNGTIVECKKCRKQFKWSNTEDVYEGGSCSESIRCPYCNDEYDTFRTSGNILIEKID